MNSKVYKSAAIAVVFACSCLSLTSCSGMSDSSVVKVQAITTGAVGGALAGGALAMAGSAIAGGGSSTNWKAAAVGAGVGLLVGAVAGNSWGDSVVEKKEAYKSTEEYIQAHMAQLDGRTTQINGAIADIDKQIQSQEAITAKAMAATQKAVNELIALTDRDINNAKESNDPQIAEKITVLEAQRNALVQRVADLDAIVAKA